MPQSDDPAGNAGIPVPAGAEGVSIDPTLTRHHTTRVTVDRKYLDKKEG